MQTLNHISNGVMQPSPKRGARCCQGVELTPARSWHQQKILNLRVESRAESVQKLADRENMLIKSLMLALNGLILSLNLNSLMA